jgi:hypothetical protein
VGLERLSIWPENEGSPVHVLFNPNSYTISKRVSWTTGRPDDPEDIDRKTNAPTLTFGGGGSRLLSFELFFDVTEAADEEKDVRDETDRIVKMTRIVRDLKRPPVCEINWSGKKTKDFPFNGTISALEQKFTLFHESGRPLRALLEVTFVEFLYLTDDQLETDPDLSTRTVRRGDSLASIAAQVYGNAAKWRDIARANGIERPLQIPPGTKLTLPKS